MGTAPMAQKRDIPQNGPQNRSTCDLSENDGTLSFSETRSGDSITPADSGDDLKKEFWTNDRIEA